MSKATDEDIAWWRACLRRLAPITDGKLAPFERRLSVRQLEAGDALLHAGDPAAFVALVREGMLREYFPLKDGLERTRAFNVAGDFAGSLSDLLRGGPARCAVVAERRSRLIVIPWSLIVMHAEDEPVRAVLAAVTRHLYLSKSEREFELLGLDAEARYVRFRQRFGPLEAQLAQRHVASYLGITPEHLSRIRARLGLATTKAPAKPQAKNAQRTNESSPSKAGPAAHISAPRSGTGQAMAAAKTRSRRSRRGNPSPRRTKPT